MSLIAPIIVLFALWTMPALACGGVTPTAADAGKICVVKQDGSGYELIDAIRFNGTANEMEAKTTVRSLLSSADGKPAFAVENFNVCALSQKKYDGTKPCSVSRDHDNNLILGDAEEATGGIWSPLPYNRYALDWNWEFDWTLPSAVQFTYFGAGTYSLVEQANGRLTLIPGTVVNDTATIQARANTYTNWDTEYRLYSYIQEAGKPVKWWFGLRSSDHLNSVSLNYENGQLSIYIANPATSYTLAVTSPAGINFRCDYTIRWPRTGDLTFYGCGAGGFPVLLATIPRTNPSIPSSSVPLYPFSQARSIGYDGRVVVDNMRLQTPR